MAASPPAGGSSGPRPVRLLQWNVLAQGLSRSPALEFVPRAVIRSASRHPHLITTIRDAQADVICLAECDHIFAEPALGTAPHGRSCLARSLRANYDAVYRCKVVGAEHGSLVAWRRDRFRLVGACGLRLDDCGDAVETNAAAPEEAAACAARLEAEGEARRLASAEGAAEAGGEAGAAATDGSAAAAKRERAPPARGELPGDALRRGNVGVLAALAPINCDPSESCRLLVVGCTHLWWQPDQPHVNAAQAVMLRDAAELFAAASVAAVAPTAPAGSEVTATTVIAADTNRFPADSAMRILRGDVAAGRAPHLLEALPRTVLDGLGAPSKRKASKALEQWACKTWADPTGLQLPKAVDLSPAEVDALASRPLFLAPELAPHRGELPDPDPVGAPVATDGPAGYFTNAVPAFSGSLDYILVSGARAAATPGSGPDAPAGEALAGAAGRSAADAGVGLRPAAASGWRVAGAAPLPDAEWALGGLGGMPNAVQASDHLPLLAVLV
ncbi:hypothetical protein FNF27_07207 [Cafeteria roenbergensis]|uniref:Endonuclease/exonuclease/phosphatase domain-containing protein n=1 Tax=Cafeteria roenbergensis TaxID=33653 RepID=A0A5A8DRZ9_CAFRO|nr:hypothetical protein FNF27_07207 [Cafeteria roenbergensis]